MRIGTVVGQVTLCRPHSTFEAATIKLILPKVLDESTGELIAMEEMIAAWDVLGSGVGSEVAFTEGPEAARPFKPDAKPVDAYVAGILDTVQLDQSSIARLFPTN